MAAVTEPADCELALDSLARGVDGLEERAALVMAVREYIGHLERTANERGEKLKQLAEGVLQPAARAREIVGCFEENGREFRVQVPSYDLAWLGDRAAEQETGLALRTELPEEVLISRLTTFAVVEQGIPKAGDLMLTLRPLSFGELDDGRGEARFAVRTLVVAGDFELEAAKDQVAQEVTAQRICEAIDRGKVRAILQRGGPGEIGVRFEDVP